jgi:ribosomal protein S27AE
VFIMGIWLDMLKDNYRMHRSRLQDKYIVKKGVKPITKIICPSCGFRIYGDKDKIKDLKTFCPRCGELFK